MTDISIHATRTQFADAQRAVVASAAAEPAPPAYTAGYLEGAMRTLLIRLEYDNRERMAEFIRESLAASKAMQ